jgi:hypothetical protein
MPALLVQYVLVTIFKKVMSSLMMINLFEIKKAEMRMKKKSPVMTTVYRSYKFCVCPEK